MGEYYTSIIIERMIREGQKVGESRSCFMGKYQDIVNWYAPRRGGTYDAFAG